MNHCKKCDIVYDEVTCPLCDARDKISELEKELEQTKEELDECQFDLKEAQRGE